MKGSQVGIDENEDIRARAITMLAEIDQTSAATTETLEHLHQVRAAAIRFLESVEEQIRHCNEMKANAVVYASQVNEILTDC